MTISTEKIKEIFSLFVGHDEIRPSFNQPFKQGLNYVATDAHSLIFLPISKCEEVSLDLGYASQDKPDVSKVVPNPSNPLKIHEGNVVEINLAELEAQLIPNYEDEMKEEEKVCDDCDGTGLVYFVYNSRKGVTHKTQEDCPVCGGVGKTTKEVPTGGKVPIMTSQFKMLGVGFQYRQLKRLLDASKIAGCSVITSLSQNPKGSNLFQVREFTILVMPCLLEEPGYMEEPVYKEIKIKTNG